jgi:hypothetical protein
MRMARAFAATAVATVSAGRPKFPGGYIAETHSPVSK